jgi:hypothetical protein
MSNLQKTNKSQTENQKEKIQCTLEHLIHKVKKEEETEHHKRIRTLIKEPTEKEDDRDFNTEVNREILEGIEFNKAPEEDVITNKILM